MICVRHLRVIEHLISNHVEVRRQGPIQTCGLWILPMWTIMLAELLWFKLAQTIHEAKRGGILRRKQLSHSKLLLQTSQMSCYCAKMIPRPCVWVVGLQVTQKHRQTSKLEVQIKETIKVWRTIIFKSFKRKARAASIVGDLLVSAVTALAILALALK